MSKYITLALACATAAGAAWQTPVNMGATLNTASNEWYPFVARNGFHMIFVSDRPGGLGGMDLWRTGYAGGSWETPVNLGASANSVGTDSVPFLAENDTRLYFVSDAPGGSGSFDIWWCPVTGGMPTSNKVNLGPPVNSAYLDCWPVPTSDGQSLYICSTRPGGHGGNDIWESHKVGGEWQTPVNLGDIVNSSGNELPRWISDDGRTLLFSSDRAGGQGNVDIWYTVYEGGAWQPPVNLGPAVNSAANELGASFKCNAGGMGGFIFFGSDRDGGRGGLDLWQAEDSEYHAVVPTSIGRVKALYR